MIIISAVVWQQRTPKPTAPKVTPNPVGRVASVTNDLKPAVATNVAPQAGPEVTELLRLMREWREKNPVYHLVMETSSGGDVASKMDLYRFRNSQGRMVNRIRNQLLQPTPVTFFLSAEAEQVLAYFPLSKQVVTINHEEQKAKYWAALGWTGQALDESALFGMAKAVFAETGPDYKALTVMFPGKLVQLPVAAGDLFVTMKLDDTGKTIGLEQLSLTGRVISKMTYLAENPEKISAGAPEIPLGAARTTKALREALEEEVNLTKKQPPKTI